MSFVLILFPAVVFGFAAYGLAWWATKASIGLAHANGLLAHPNHRSSHTTPTPRVGGIGLVLGVLVPMGVYLPLAGSIQGVQRLTEIDPVDARSYLAAGIAVVLAFLLGLWDDRGDPPALAKLAGQFLVAAIPPSLGLRLEQLHVPLVGFLELPAVAGWLLSFVWLLAMMNAVNFMDGINGLAGRFAVVVAIGLLVCTFNRAGCTELVVLAAVLWGAAEGFLAWNAPEARTFLGDCGSQPLGALAALAVLLLATNDLGVTITAPDGATFPLFDPFLGGVILVAPFLFDVGLTLVRRAARGANILEAHREHLYQRHLIATGESHDQTLGFVCSVLWTNAIIAVVYVRFSMEFTAAGGWTRESLRAAALAACAFSLFTYWRRVVRAERAAATGAG
jgi:UDP-N-acetylmuramyl pentapeptide phosphotransferase/UDP-N-acetylglucosamine-1-phosphate transferase